MQFLDAETRRQLGFDEIWSRITPVSALGRARQRKAKAFLPEQAADLQAELARLERVSLRLRQEREIATELSYLLSMLRDVSGSLHRSLQGAILDDMEFYEIKKLLLITEKVQTELERLQWTSLLPSPLDFCTQCKKALSIGQGSHDSFYISDAYDQSLAAVRQERSRLESSLASFRANVEAKMVEVVGRVLSMDDEIIVSKTDGGRIAQLETLSQLSKVEETPAIVKFRLLEDEAVHIQRAKLAAVREQEEAYKQQVRERLTGVVRQHAGRLLANLDRLGYLDLLLAKAKFGAEMHGIKPNLRSRPGIYIQDGRHPLIEEDVKASGYAYTPLDIQLGSGVTLITGPNMGGKTVSLRTIGLLTAMAQFGLLVPATLMEFRPCQAITAHLAEAEIPKGLSAFAGEIAFLRDAMACSEQETLILVDEIAHGTNPVEGATIAQAVMEKLASQPSITVLTTHYPSLARLAGITHLRVKGLNKDKLKEDWDVISTDQIHPLHHYMDYRLEEAAGEQPLQSDAVVVAEALGLNAGVIDRAKELLRASKGVARRNGYDQSTT